MKYLNKKQSETAALQGLVAMEHDLVAAHEIVLSAMRAGAAKMVVAAVCERHRIHARSLKLLIMQRGEKVPILADLRSIIIEARASLWSMVGLWGKLNVVFQCEQTALDTYHYACARYASASLDVQCLLEELRDDEQRLYGNFACAKERLLSARYFGSP